MDTTPSTTITTTMTTRTMPTPQRMDAAQHVQMDKLKCDAWTRAPRQRRKAGWMDTVHVRRDDDAMSAGTRQGMATRLLFVSRLPWE
jgi:hypothetical protein